MASIVSFLMLFLAWCIMFLVLTKAGKHDINLLDENIRLLEKIGKLHEEIKELEEEIAKLKKEDT